MDWMVISESVFSTTDTIGLAVGCYCGSKTKFETVGLMPQVIGVIGETGGGGLERASNCEPSQDWLCQAKRSLSSMKMLEASGTVMGRWPLPLSIPSGMVKMFPAKTKLFTDDTFTKAAGRSAVKRLPATTIS